jgi:HD superfamily phosphodiesterase
MNLIAIRQIAEDTMLDRYGHPDRGIGDSYFHGQRTAKLAVTLRKLILPEDDSHDEILTVAGWFHDIGKGMPQHARYGAALAKEALKDHLTPDELTEVAEIIALHGNRGHSEYSDWIKIQQDADFIDHGGTYFIWFNFTSRAWLHKGDIAEIAREQTEVFHDDMRKDLDKLNFAVSRKIAEEKLQFQEMFWQRMKTEANGEIWDINNINTGE